GPMRTTFSPARTSRSRWSRTTLSPNRFTTPSRRTSASTAPAGAGSAWRRCGACSSLVAIALLQMTDGDRRRDADDQEQEPGHGERLETTEPDPLDLARLSEQLENRDGREEGSVLQHGHDVVAQRWDDARHCLGQHDVAPRVHSGEVDRRRRLP